MQRRLAGVRVADQRDDVHARAPAAASRCRRGRCDLARARLESRMRSRISRRSVSSCVSPGPRVPMPPPRRSRCCPHARRAAAASTRAGPARPAACPRAVRACWAKMSRMSPVRSTTAGLQPVLQRPLLARRQLALGGHQVGLRAPRPAAELLQAALPQVGAGVGPVAALHQRGITSAPAVRSSSASSAMRVASSSPARGREAMRTARSRPMRCSSSAARPIRGTCAAGPAFGHDAHRAGARREPVLPALRGSPAPSAAMWAAASS